MNAQGASDLDASWESVDSLRRSRPRSLLVRFTMLLFLALALLSWTTGVVSFGALFDGRRRGNISRFLSQELMPFPLRTEGFSFGGLWSWASELWWSRGLAATLTTLQIAVLATVLAGAAGALLAPLGARSLMTVDPFVKGRPAGKGVRQFAWRSLSVAARVFGVLLRAIPEYVWAFLLLAILGPSAWPVVLALAVHNAGILSRLGADTLENLDPRPLRALHGLGASRRQVLAEACVPAALPRYLLYFFYRYETCVREATVLGMLGIVSLGYWIQDSRARLRYDDMLFLVLLGGLLVMVGELTSVLARWWIRRAK
ncbi:MAG: phosphonate transport system permease protein [Planctomycetota bacterium]|jgi:phosphonate transport system permease protein